MSSSCPSGPAAGQPGQSSAPGTRVLLASGKAVPASFLKAGDKVLMRDSATGQNQPGAVTAVLVHHPPGSAAAFARSRLAFP